jgi:serine/threonine-protein kinase
LSTTGDLTGVRIAGKYELLRQIGRGGMGAVYEARNVSTLKRCAVKVLLTPELAGDEEVVKRFFREARASGLIESEHVVAAYDSGVDDAGHAYYVMDALHGEDLQQALSRLGALPPNTVAKIVLQAANGLASAHLLGIVHRDVKPANLFLSVAADDEIKVKILDFGVAKVKMEVFHESSHQLTRTGSMLGTPLYMSPEQVKRASAIDESADVWSLGVVMFESLTGKLPWGTVESFGELIAAVLTLDLPLLQDHAPWVPPELAALVHRTLSRDPASRTRKAAELREALREFLKGDGRLFRRDLTTVSERERAIVAERLSLADTMIAPAGRQSGGPLVSSIRPRSASLGRLLVAAASVSAVVGSSAWIIARRTPPLIPLAPTHVLATAIPTQIAASETALPPAPSSAPALPSVSFPFEVGPHRVHVSIDGVSSTVRDGRVLVEGRVGSEHIVELARGKLKATQLVVISDHGVVPPKVMSPLADVTKPTNPASTDSNPKVSGKEKSADADPESESDGGLSPDFK